MPSFMHPFQIAELLAENGYLNLQDRLLEAVLAGKFQLASFLMQAGANIKERCRFGNTYIIQEAAADADPTALRYVLNSKVDVNSFNSIGLTALMIAVGFGYKKSVELLLSHGADPRLFDKHGNTVFQLIESSSKNENDLAIKNLLDKALEKLADTPIPETNIPIPDKISTTKVADSGNCFFESISQQLEAIGIRIIHEQLREMGINQILTNLEFYANYQLDIGQYIIEMSSTGTWAEGIIIHSLASALGIRIFIHTPNHIYDIAPEQGFSRDIHINYNGVDHYWSHDPELDATPNVTNHISLKPAAKEIKLPGNLVIPKAETTDKVEIIPHKYAPIQPGAIHVGNSDHQPSAYDNCLTCLETSVETCVGYVLLCFIGMMTMEL